MRSRPRASGQGPTRPRLRRACPTSPRPSAGTIARRFNASFVFHRSQRLTSAMLRVAAFGRATGKCPWALHISVNGQLPPCPRAIPRPTGICRPRPGQAAAPLAPLEYRCASLHHALSAAMRYTRRCIARRGAAATGGRCISTSTLTCAKSARPTASAARARAHKSCRALETPDFHSSPGLRHSVCTPRRQAGWPALEVHLRRRRRIRRACKR